MRPYVWLVGIAFILGGCAVGPTSTPRLLTPAMTKEESPSTLAVWNLEDLSPPGMAPMDLGELLSTRIVDTFQQNAGVTVVERERIELALRELHLGSSDLADEAVRLRIGKIAGAKRMVFGAYQVIGGQMRLDLRMVDVETGRILRAAERSAGGSDIPGWLKAAEDAAKELM